MSKLILYSYEMSPPCRAVLMTAHAIGVKFNIQEINLLFQENLTNEYTKINPQKTIPTLDDDGFILGDSHAINCYLVGKYAKNDSLYPKDLQKRALVDQFLYFDTGELFAATKSAFKLIFTQKATSIPEKEMNRLKEAFDCLNRILQGKKWMTGDSYTLADINCVSTASSAAVVLNMDDYPNVKSWIERCEKELPGYKECNEPGLKHMHMTLLARLKQE